MKKTLWMLGVAVAALTSCTESEVLDVPESKVIAFEPFVGKPTRAVDDIELDNLNNFYTYGANSHKTDADFDAGDAGFNGTLFNDVTMEKVEQTNNYSYPQNEWVKWEMDNYYRFAAYSNGNAKLIGVTPFWNASKEVQVKNNQGGLEPQILDNLWGLTITNYERQDEDLLIAVPAERSTVNNYGTQSAVNFTFEHALAKVIFRFQYTKPAAGKEYLRMRVRRFDVKTITKSNCDAFYFSGQETYINWGSQYDTTDDVEEACKSNITYFSDEEFIPKNSIANLMYHYATDVFYMIPQKNDIIIDKIVVETVDDKDTDEESDDVVTAITTFEDVSLHIPEHQYWLPGYVYRYTASLTPGEDYIEFMASVTDWHDEANRDATLNGVTSAND